MVRKKAQVCPKCKKPAATLLEWPQLNWWPGVLCWPCVQEYIEKDHARLEAAQRERESLEKALVREMQSSQVERTKREEAEARRDTAEAGIAEAWRLERETIVRALEAERRLGEVLAALEEVSEAAFWYGNSRSKPKATNADRKKGDRIFAALTHARAVLASATERECTYCKGRGVIGIEARLCAVCRGRGKLGRNQHKHETPVLASATDISTKQEAGP